MRCYKSNQEVLPIICGSLYSWECRELENYSGGNHFKFFKGDGAKAITLAWSEVSFFYMQSNIKDCKYQCILEEKYLNIDSDQNTTISLKKFFQYLESTWIQSMKSNSLTSLQSRLVKNICWRPDMRLAKKNLLTRVKNLPWQPLSREDFVL